MSNWSLTWGGANEETGTADTTDSAGTAVTSGGTAHATGGWQQVILSTGQEWQAFTFQVGAPTNSNFPLFSIGIGASSKEIAIVENLSVNYRRGRTWYLPVRVPRGSRVVVSVQDDDAAARSYDIVIHGHSMGFGGMPGFGRCVAYGADTSASKGTVIDPGATPNTKGGGWVELTSSTSDPIRAMAIGVSGNYNTNQIGMNALIDVGMGAATEDLVIENLWLDYPNTETLSLDWAIFPASIPAGTRLVVRSQSSTGDATGRLVDVILYGFT